MKILFATGKLNKGFSPTGKIIFQLACRLAQQGHSCCICGFCADEQPSDTVENGVRLLRLSSGMAADRAQRKFDEYSETLGENKRAAARKSFMLRHPLNAAVLAYRYSAFFDGQKRAKIYGKKIKQLCAEEKYDIVVPVYMPFYEAMAVCSQLGGSVPLCLYQTDPWGLHRLPEYAKDMPLHIRQETQIFDTAQRIITTPALYRLYRQEKDYLPYADKLTPLNFPNIQKPDTSHEQPVFRFDKSDINILFCGLLEDEYRSPKVFLEAAAKLIENGLPLKIHFLGTSTSRHLQYFIKKYPQNIIHHQAVSFPRAFATMQSADFLLNLSNTLDNQVPSKIFDYFSLGKPVINVQKIKNCPAREYFDRYPAAFTFEDFAPDEESLERFITQSKGKIVDFDTVKEIFKDATVEYAAEVLEKVLSEAVNSKSSN